MIRGEFLDFSTKQINDVKHISPNCNWDDLDYSQSFREQCVEGGFKLLHIYPCLHQGWEFDEWGAIAEKNGYKYVLETSHGSIKATKMKKKWKPEFKTMKIFVFKEDE